ncbi:prolipoprotein diacylglyceryltransferase [Cupriavidus sp. GA3-3]|nr:prolipoprotein diacylglyceryltransferase [Cupriavidus sp. GA3-3]
MSPCQPGRPPLRIAPRRPAASAAAGEDLVDQAVVNCLVAAHEVVAIGIARNLLDRLARHLGQDGVEPLAQVQDLARLNLDVRGLAARAAQRLVDHDARVGQRRTLALGASRQQERAHACRHAHAQRGHVRLDELHGVVDRQPRRYGTARRVDVQRHVLVGVLALEEQQLGHHQVGGLVVDLAHHEHHALLQQARVDVIGALAPAGLLDDHRHQPQALGFQCRSLRGGETVKQIIAGHACSPWIRRIARQSGVTREAAPAPRRGAGLRVTSGLRLAAGCLRR